MKVSKNSKYQTKRVSNSRKTQTTELARQVPASAGTWRAKKGGPFRIFQHPLLQNINKLKGALWGKFFRKKSQCQKN